MALAAGCLQYYPALIPKHLPPFACLIILTIILIVIIKLLKLLHGVFCAISWFGGWSKLRWWWWKTIKAPVKAIKLGASGSPLPLYAPGKLARQPNRDSNTDRKAPDVEMGTV
jgi:hypothetical protein